MIIRKIESIIDFNSHTTDLYDIKYLSPQNKTVHINLLFYFKDLMKCYKPYWSGDMFLLQWYLNNEHFLQLHVSCQSWKVNKMTVSQIYPVNLCLHPKCPVEWKITFFYN